MPYGKNEIKRRKPDDIADPDKPDEVNVADVETEQRIIYELTVGDGDYGKIIGKGGRNISAIRTIIFAINAKQGGKRARLDVID